MKITSSSDLFFALSEGQRLGQVRRAFWKVCNDLIRDMTKRAVDGLEIVSRDGVSGSRIERREAWRGIIDLTNKVAAACESLGQLKGSEASAKRVEGDVVLATMHLIELADAAIPEAILPPDLRGQLQAIMAGEPDPERFARTLLGLTLPAAGPDMGETIGWFNELRLRALNAHLLSEIAGASPEHDAAAADDLDGFGRDAADQSAALRDAALDAARALLDDEATPAIALSMWGAVYTFEQWLIEEGAAMLARLAAAATARVDAGDDDAERWAREVAQAYDAIRLGLGYDAGLRAVLLSYALHDARRLTDFAQSSDLALASATLDLPRSGLSAIAEATEGDVVEIGGMVSAAEFQIGGASNRSLLSLGAPAAVRVLVPHVAVDSFGITQGVWVQVRGKAFPDGKDGIAGPVVMAGRVPRADAARDSFTDALIFAGRTAYDVRPSDLDLVAGRVAGDRATLNEIGMRE